MLQQSFRRSALIAAVLAPCLVVGCSKVMPSSGPNEASARAKIQTELDRWVAGDRESQAAGFDWKISADDPPLSYKLRNVFPTTPNLSTDMLMRLDKEKKGWPEKDGPAFKIIVDADFKSQADTVLTKVQKYTLTWVQSITDWDVHEEM